MTMNIEPPRNKKIKKHTIHEKKKKLKANNNRKK